MIDGGLEVGEATDIIFNTSNSKQGIGMVGNLTNGALTRTDYYVQTAILSLLPFIHPELYWVEFFYLLLGKNIALTLSYKKP